MNNKQWHFEAENCEVFRKYSKKFYGFFLHIFAFRNEINGWEPSRNKFCPVCKAIAATKADRPGLTAIEAPCRLYATFPEILFAQIARQLVMKIIVEKFVLRNMLIEHFFPKQIQIGLL